MIKIVKQEKLYLLIAILFFCIHGNSQTITKYYDSSWREVAKEQAFYYGHFVKDNDVYQASYYWSDSNQLYERSVYVDTSFKKHTGVSLRYYRAGKVKDSMQYSGNGNLVSYDEFKENGAPDFHAFYDEKEHYMKGQHFDDKGQLTPEFFVFQKPAMFPGGIEGWTAYLQTHLKADVPSRKKAPVGNYTVMISFLVNKEGKISEVTAMNDPGYGTAEEAVRVIQEGPNWIPAIQNNRHVNYRQRQTITFQVSEGR